MAGIQIDGVNNKIDFDDDQDTSISSNTDDTLVIETGGTDRVTITDGNVAIAQASGTVLSLGNVSASATSTPVEIDFGGTYSDTAGQNPMLNLWNNGASGAFMGIGVSGNQLDYMTSATTYDHVFYGNSQSSPTELMRVHGDGDVTIADGNIVMASGHGINFAATSDTAGMSGELLDDYEEGTWTAAFTDGSNNYTMNNSYKTGQYVKIGCVVHIWGYFTVSDVDGGGANENTSTKISGLPFSVSPNNVNNYASVHIGYTNSMALPNALSVPTGYIEISNSYIYLVQNGATDGIIAVTGVHISDGGTLMLSATYRTT